MRAPPSSAWIVAGMFALAALGCCTTPAAPVQPEFNQRSTAVSLNMSDGGCSGTIYLKHTVLTAAHCLAGGALVDISGKPAKVLGTVKDKTDHVFVVTDQTFEVTLPTTRFSGGLKQGTEITFYGSPLGIPDQYRQGYVTGTCKANYCFPGVAEVLDLPGEYPVTLMSVMGQHGDSGAGIYNRAGEIVGVVSLIQERMPAPFVPMGALPFTFTQADIAQVALMDEGIVDAMAPAQ